MPKKAHSVKVNNKGRLGEEGYSPDTEDYSSTSLDGAKLVESDEPAEGFQEAGSD